MTSDKRFKATDFFMVILMILSSFIFFIYISFVYKYEFFSFKLIFLLHNNAIVKGTKYVD